MGLTRPKARQINFDVTNISDPLIALNKVDSQPANNLSDSGLVMVRGSGESNVAIIWDESADHFALVNTTEDGTTDGNIAITSYSAVKTGTIDVNNERITNLADPVSNDDAATKSYVTSQLSSGLDADTLEGNAAAYFAPQSTTYTKAEVDSKDAAIISGIDWKEAVTNFADLATTHTSPVEGWTASVNSEDTVYRYDGSSWVALANGTVPLATGALDGKLSSSDFTKLSNIETAATADQTGAEIKSAYEGESNTNAYTDTEKTKLSNIETAATADQTGAEIKSAYEGESNTNAYTDTEKTKLSNIETAATADQTKADIDALNIDASTLNSYTTATAATANTVALRDASGNLTAINFNGIASSAKYADVAEKYIADEQYEPGTVLVFGGQAEVTACTDNEQITFAGVVSTDPAYLMNSGLDAENTVEMALLGRIPCKVVGKVTAGDIIISSDTKGYGRAFYSDKIDPRASAIVGKAITSKDTLGEGVIEILVGRV